MPDTPTHEETEVTIHASAVALAGQCVLIQGASGTGKSSLALDLISRGGALISDDRTRLWRSGNDVIAGTPNSIAGQIEARGVGILNAPMAGPCRVALVVDLDHVETQRLPGMETLNLLNVDIRYMLRSEMTCFPAAILLYLSHGRSA